MTEKSRIPIVKHLEDADDLQQGRDAEIVQGQEHLAETMAESIYQHALANGLRAVIFCVSPKKRAAQTARLVQVALSRKAKAPRVVVETDSNLREIDQGTFVLPENYKPGDEYEGLKVAWRIFTSETFNADPSKDNLDYHFGDPVQHADGSYEHPELARHFTGYGESYREILLRFYVQVLKLAENADRFGDRTGVVVFTHGQPHWIFSNLSEVADQVVNGNLVVAEGSLPRICWDLYNSRPRRQIPFGELAFVSSEHIANPQIMTLLKREISHLEKEAPKA